MASKSDKRGLKDSDTVLAVVIADSFDTKFGPLTTSGPRCLLPLANRPLLSYTLECLKMSGVQEVFVYCTSFADRIKQYLTIVDWPGMTITAIINEECRSLGDAMRDLDAKGLLRQDFILLSGDTVANANLGPILNQHKKSCLEDKDATMTLVYKKALPGHHCRTADQEVFVAASKSKKVLHHCRATAKNVKLPLTLFECCDANVDLRFDLLDPGIAICSQSMPLLFSDNFDCQTLDEFVKEVLQNDLTDNTVYMADLDEDAYAARVTDFNTFVAVGQDVVNRWLFPIVPDGAVAKTTSPYSYNRHNVYKCPDIILKRGSVLEEDVIVGHGGRIGEDSVVRHSMLGSGCCIGPKASISDSVLFDNIKIGDNCQIVGSVLGNNVVIGDNVVIQAKCVLGDGVEIQSGLNLQQETWLVSSRPTDGFSDDEDGANEGPGGHLGPKAFRYVGEGDDDEDSDDSDHVKVSDSLWGMNLGREDDDEDSSSSSDSDLSGFDETQMPDILLDDDAKYQVFHSEVFESLQRGAKEGVTSDNLALEVNSSRHAYAVTPGQVIQSVLTSILTIAEGSGEGAKLLAQVKKLVGQFTDLIGKYVRSPLSQADCLKALEVHTKGHKETFLPILAKLVQVLYDVELVSEEAVLVWYQKAITDSDLKKKVKPFVEWLQEEDEESSEQDDESSE